MVDTTLLIPFSPLGAAGADVQPVPGPSARVQRAERPQRPHAGQAGLSWQRCWHIHHANHVIIRGIMLIDLSTCMSQVWQYGYHMDARLGDSPGCQMVANTGAHITRHQELNIG